MFCSIEGQPMPIIQAKLQNGFPYIYDQKRVVTLCFRERRGAAGQMGGEAERDGLDLGDFDPIVVKRTPAAGQEKVGATILDFF